LRARVELCLGSASRSVYESLAVEARQGGPSKGRVRVSLEGGCVVIEVDSDSYSGLRALLNSYLLLAHAAYSAVTLAGSGGGRA